MFLFIQALTSLVSFGTENQCSMFDPQGLPQLAVWLVQVIAALLKYMHMFDTDVQSFKKFRSYISIFINSYYLLNIDIGYEYFKKNEN